MLGAMRVAYLTSFYPRVTDVWLQREVRALRARGVDLHTFTVRSTDPGGLLSDAQRDEHARTTAILPSSPTTIVRAHATAIARRPRRYLRAIRLAFATRAPGLAPSLKQVAYFVEAGVLATELRRRRIDHLHNHLSDASCTVAMLASELSGVPFSFTMHGPSIFYEPEKWRIDEKLRRASYVACISWFCRSQAAAWVEPEHWEKLKIVHCGVDVDELRPSHGSGGTQLLFVGRLTGFKGLPVLLDAMPSIVGRRPGTRLVLVGDGPDREALEAQVRRLGLEDSVEFAGSRSPADVAALLAATDVFVLPSFAEGVPTVLMEALGAEVPVVTTRIAGVSELVEDGVSGLLVPPSDPTALADAVTSLLGDPERRRTMGANGRRVVLEQFDAAVEASRHLTLLHADDPVTGTPVRPPAG